MIGIAALVTCALFCGAALYILVAEHPARRALDPTAQLTQWKPSYSRATRLQASLAALSGLLGIAEALAPVRGGASGIDSPWLVGAACMLGAIAYTFAAIWRLNGRLQDTPVEQASTDTVALLDRWARLHLVRTVIALAGLLAYVLGMLQSLAFQAY